MACNYGVGTFFIVIHGHEEGRVKSCQAIIKLLFFHSRRDPPSPVHVASSGWRSTGRRRRNYIKFICHSDVQYVINFILFTTVVAYLLKSHYVAVALRVGWPGSHLATQLFADRWIECELHV